ncbi:MarR family transcriptional regulator [Sulfitobacter pseudonitzschiae]|uniref:MarR family transcriptional regulator n=1 Tax=Pseudosulfitobacter pseudonitzschiae TaxID=1402135 RepID=A0A9Q2NN55_9RHOB|nr:MarR family winged helix-turn-helix transcriptional regulator [Pseudosulfitobacter pseudonitzschiae]MBM2293803.1 MarR family transcriptional regulator [Pseudosulfitobacter pseudonitzschiae]MBM2298720.1 MarR family transcriptional regulator [Pseudosulfitobacter pseudonitzschiae]MBM2303635.1 MarR family transcriptional regulator [Pseudosulfitobacter pseudonitzschiae]MBM2313417.1 MarR family transcriptional regulator [Pseudosulfitobacter pseudonitzschiae]MBM2318331.1 MarR family transcriptiona
MSGTVNIPRTIWKDPAFKPQPFTEREAYMWIVMEASYKPRERRILNAIAHTDRGQLFVSVRFMAEAWDWSKSTVDRFLKRLEKRDIIKIKSGTGGNIITVCDYDEIQNTPDYNGTPAGQVAGQRWDTGGTPVGQQRDKPNIDSIPDEIQEQKAPDLFPETKPVPKETAHAILSEIIPPDLAKDFIEHRKSIKKPLTVLAARRVANELRLVSNPVASVNASIGNGWAGVFERNTPRAPATASPSSVDRILDRVNQRNGGGS